MFVTPGWASQCGVSCALSSSLNVFIECIIHLAHVSHRFVKFVHFHSAAGQKINNIFGYFSASKALSFSRNRRWQRLTPHPLIRHWQNCPKHCGAASQFFQRMPSWRKESLKLFHIVGSSLHLPPNPPMRKERHERHVNNVVGWTLLLPPTSKLQEWPKRTKLHGHLWNCKDIIFFCALHTEPQLLQLYFPRNSKFPKANCNLPDTISPCIVSPHMISSIFLHHAFTHLTFSILTHPTLPHCPYLTPQYLTLHNSTYLTSSYLTPLHLSTHCHCLTSHYFSAPGGSSEKS